MIDYELVIDDAGTATLTCGGEVIWVSDEDDEFSEEFPGLLLDFDDDEATGEVIEWLQDQGYVPPDVPVHIVEDDSAETGSHRVIESDEDEDEDEDEGDDHENV